MTAGTLARQAATPHKRKQGKVNVRLVISIVILLGYGLVAFIGPVLVVDSPLAQDLSQALEPPGTRHLLGTDELGRDIFSRIVYGGRISLIIMVTSVLPACALGTLIGMSMGYRGGLIDGILMRIVDAMMAFPGFLLGLMVVSLLGTGTQNLIVAIMIYLLPSFIRVSRSAALVVREAAYIEASCAAGGSTPWILFRHVLPNILTPIIVQLSVLMGSALLITSGLSFLGLGVPRPTPEWGLMLADGRAHLRTAPHVALVPGLVLMLLLLALNTLGDGLRDALDPQSRQF